MSLSVIADVDMMISWKKWDWASAHEEVMDSPYVRQQIWEIGLLQFFGCEMIWSSKDLLDPLIRLWRLEERSFDIREVMFPLYLHDVYFLIGLLICEIWEATHPLLVGQSSLGLLANIHYGGDPNAISDRSL